MGNDKLRELLSTLREFGVTNYEDSDVKLALASVPVLPPAVEALNDFKKELNEHSPPEDAKTSFSQLKVRGFKHDVP